MKPNVIIIGNTSNFDIANGLLVSKKLSIIGGIVDKSSNDLENNQRKFLLANNIKEVSISDVQTLRPDLCIMLAYTKIINTEYFKNTILLNIHAGLLPKWRGMNSNAWAIINGEKDVAYTLHEANNVLDGGDIYYQFIEKINSTQKYGDIIPKLRAGMIDNLPSVLVKIFNKEINPISQDNENFIYTPKIRKEDGYITKWNFSSKYIYNLYIHIFLMLT